MRFLLVIGLGFLSVVVPAMAQVTTKDAADSATKNDNDDTDDFTTPSRHPREHRPKAATSGRHMTSRSVIRGTRRASPDRRVGRPENRWRYEYYNGYWWYWTPERRWAFFNGRRWIDYDSELAKRWAGGAVGYGAMGLGGGGSYGLGGDYEASGMNGVLGGGWTNPGLGSIGDLGTNAGAVSGGRLPGQGTFPGRSALPGYRGGTSQAAGGLSPIGAGGSLDTAVTGEGLGSSLFGSNGGMAAVPGLSGTRGSLGGASGVGINAGGSSIGIGGR